jgi:hypothetical protein
MLSARQLRLRLPTVPLPLGEAVELQHDLDLGGQQQLDLAAQAAQAERHDGRPQLGRAGDVAVPLVKVTLTSNRSSRIGYPRASCLGRSCAPDACGL